MTTTMLAPTGRTTTGTPPARRRRPPWAWGRAGTTTVLWLYAIVAILPLLSMVMSSMRTNRDLALNPLGLPQQLDFTSYQRAWVEASFSTYFANSVLVTVSSVLLSTVVSLFAAYAFARSNSRIMQFIEAVFISGLMMPVFLMIVPIFYLLDSFGLISSRLGLVLVYSAVSIPFSVFVLSTFFRQLPIELEEAARIDGASTWRMFWQIAVPLVRPAIATWWCSGSCRSGTTSSTRSSSSARSRTTRCPWGSPRSSASTRPTGRPSSPAS